MKYEINDNGGNNTTGITSTQLSELFRGLAQSIPKKGGIVWNAFTSTSQICVHKFDMDREDFDSRKIGEWKFDEIQEAISFLQGVAACED